MKTNVLLLVLVLEELKTLTWENMILTQLTFQQVWALPDRTVKKLEFKLELIKDVKQYMFIGSGMRDASTVVGKRYDKANHKDCDDYNQDGKCLRCIPRC